MNTNTNTPDAIEKIFSGTDAGTYWHNSPSIVHVLLILALVALVHLVVKAIHQTSEWLIHKSHAKKSPLGFVTGTPKFVTITQLIVSAVTFSIYFVAFGLILIACFISATAS